MEQGRYGRRGDHGAGEPGRKGELGRFYQPCECDADRGEKSESRVQLNQFVQFHDMGGTIQIDKADREDQPPQQVHLQGPEHTLNGLLVVPVADQQGRADSRYFPEKEDPDQVVGEDNAEHGRKEEVNEESEILAPIFYFLMVLVIFRDIADRVQTYGAPDNADDQRHDDRELIDEQAVLDLHMSADGKLEGDHEHRLDDDEDHGNVLFCPYRDEDDERGNEHFYPKHEQIDRVALYLEIYGALYQDT